MERTWVQSEVYYVCYHPVLVFRAWSSQSRDVRRGEGAKVGSAAALVPSEKPQEEHEQMQSSQEPPPTHTATASEGSTLSSSSILAPPSIKRPTPSADQPTRPTRSTTRSFSPDRRPWPERSWQYQYRPFRGIWADLRRRAPYYASDWTEGVKSKNWERVVGATIRMFFLNLCVLVSFPLSSFRD